MHNLVRQPRPEERKDQLEFCRDFSNLVVDLPVDFFGFRFHGLKIRLTARTSRALT